MRVNWIATAALALASGVAAAAPVDEVRAGVVIQGAPGLISPDKEDGVGLGAEVLFHRLMVLKAIGAPRPTIGVNLATGEHATSAAYGGLTWEQNLGRRLFIDGGLGLAVHDGEVSFTPGDPLMNERDYYGCRVLFHLSADMGFRITDRASIMVHMDHMSNARLCSENEGLDNAGVRLGFTF